MNVIWIGYTTLYREGGTELARAAKTLAQDRADRADRAGRSKEAEIVLDRIESKRDFVDAMDRISARGGTLSELHFVGHAGMYGPMFRTTAMPEQFSPHEWRDLAATRRIPFAAGGEAYFHACRTARWFAPFFARTFGVPASGFHWYTTFSARPDRFAYALSPTAPLYLIGCRGKKSDGLVGSALKYLGAAAAEPFKRFVPDAEDVDVTYDSVADLYDEVFPDIRVRKPEWEWLEAHLPSGGHLRVLDIGCGNGALLQALAPRLATGLGVDLSAGMIGAATRRNRLEKLSFQTIAGPTLPAADHSIDVVTSLLSFRYLDWDPVMNEIRRVLAPGGRLLVVDMVTAPVALREVPALFQSTARAVVGRLGNKAYRTALARLTRDPRWAKMLQYNPIRAQHEYVWYLESRFPGRKVEKLDVGWHNRVLAFDSGPLQPGTVAPQTYP